MNILTIKDVYVTKGKEFLENLLDSTHITVFENIDGNSFGFMKTGEDDYTFYKNNKSQEITEIDRILTNMYDLPISYILTLPKDVRDSIPLNTKFNFDYIQNTSAPNIQYDTIPKNHLILSYIETENGKKVEDIETLNFYADMLDVDRCPIIFNGTLTPQQKSDILEFVETPFEDLKEKYNSTSFAQYLLFILNPDLKSTKLNNSLESPIKGVIFKFVKDNETYYTKIYDVFFEDLIKSKNVNSPKKASDNYYLILSDILDFVQIQNIKKINLKQTEFTKRYIELISILFNRFIKSKGSEYIEIDFKLPEYLKDKNFKINSDIIKNKETVSYIENNMNFTELYKIFIAGFRKKRKKTNYIFTKELNFHFNNVVKAITDASAFSEIDEAFITFKDFKRIYIDDEDSRDVLGVDIETHLENITEEIEEYKEPKFDTKEFLSSMFVKTKKEKRNKKKKEDINLIIDTFSPMTNFVYELCEFASGKDKRKFIGVCVHTDTKNKNSYISKNTLTKIFKNLTEETNSFKDFMFVERPILSKVFSALEDYNVKKIYCSEMFERMINVQIELNKKKNVTGFDFEKIEDILEVYNFDISVSSKLKNCVINNNFTGFKEHVPLAYSNIFSEIVADSEIYFMDKE